jgi:ATP-dependent helicase/nuclease subunit A
MKPPAGPALPDAEDRRRSATIFDRNLVVTAGAGTGKTALLVERALNLIAGAGIEVEAIAAITFTEKAAAELRSRLARGLDELRSLAQRRRPLSEADPRSEAGRAYAWLLGGPGVTAPEIEGRALRALHDLDAAAVSTIHGFCSEILRRHPLEARVDPSYTVDEGPGFEAILEREWERFLARELGPAAGREEIWRRAFRHPGALGAVRDLARALASFSLPAQAADPGRGYAAAPFERLFGGPARRALQEIRLVLQRASGMNPNMQRFLAASSALLEALLAGGPGALVAAAGSLPDYLEKDPPAPGARLAGAGKEEVAAAAGCAQELIAALAAVDEEAVAALHGAALPLAAACRELLLSSGRVSFDALLRLTRDLLAGQAGVRRAVARRYRTILVDEFQDTDPLQYDILLFLAEAEGPPAADPFQAALAPGRLFIVGDPKQSIYRFRGADIEAYRRAVDRIVACGGERLTLTASFRSPPEIVGPINAIFQPWIGRSPEGETFEPAYDPIDSARGPCGDAAGRVEIWSVEAEGNVEERRRAEADAIAAWIAGNVRPAEEGGDPAYRDVALLLRALTNAGLYAQALRRAGIPFVVEGGRDFYERPEIGDLLAFLRASANPNDAASVLAVLRSPLGGAPDSELLRFAEAGGRLDDAGAGPPDPAAFPNLRRAFDLLSAFRLGTIGRSPDRTLRAALRDTPLPLLHACAFEGAQRLANLRKLVARAETLARDGLSLEETLDALEREVGGERSEGESPLADETVDAVRILSIHKAKGLEFPLVFVPDVGRQARTRPETGTRAAWLRRDGGHLAIRLAGGATNLAWACLADLDRRHAAAEEKRVFYVACTRARERLILVNSSRGRSAPWREALGAVGYQTADGYPADGPIHEGRIAHRRVAPRRVSGAGRPRRPDPIWAKAAAAFETTSRSAAATATVPIRWPAGARDEALAAEGLRADDAPLRRGGAGGRDAARRAGSAVHAALERWDFGDPSRLREVAREEAGRMLQGEEAGSASGRGLGPEVVREAAQIVDEFLASPLPARLAGLAVVGKEVPLLYRDASGATWLGACDLIYRDPDGTLVVADYKTDRIEGDPTAVAQRYRAQLETYRAALRRAAPGERCRAEVLLLRKGLAVPI